MPDRLKELEAEVLSRELTPAVPVGLRYDRLAREGWLPEPRSSEREGRASASAGPSHSERALRTRAYWACNCLAVSALLDGVGRVCVRCEESWAGGLRLPPTACVELWRDREPGADVEQPADALTASRGSTEAVPVPSADAPIPAAAKVPHRLFDAVLADSSVLLSGGLAESLSDFRRVLCADGRVVLLVANWEYEMEGEPVRYDLSFRRCRGRIHAGLVKRTLEPASEVEYVCLLDDSEPAVRKLAQLPRDELRLLGAGDVPGLERLVTAVEVIRIPQATVPSLEAAGREAGFSRSVIAGAPGILAARMDSAAQSIGVCWNEGTVSPGLAREPLESSAGLADKVLRALASSFPFVPAGGSPHLLGVFDV